MQREPRSSEELIEDVIGLTVTVRESTTDHMNANVFIELSRGHSQVLKVLDHLEARVGHSCLVVTIDELALALSALRIGPGEDWGDNHKGLLLSLMFMQGLSKDLNNLLSLIKVSPAEKVNNDAVSIEQGLAEGFGLTLSIKELDLLVR